MSKSIAVVLSAVIWLTASLEGQGVPSTPPSPDLRRITVTSPVAERDLQDAFSLILTRAGLSGGIAQIHDGCGDNGNSEREYFVPAGTSLSDALEQLPGVDRSHGWAVRANVVTLTPVKGVPRLMRTVIREVHVSDTTNLVRSLDEVLRTKEVQDALALLSLMMPRASDPGFQKLKRWSERPEGKPADLSNLTLEDALNFLAGSHPGAVWAYDEYHCGGKGTFRLDFISR